MSRANRALLFGLAALLLLAALYAVRTALRPPGLGELAVTPQQALEPVAAPDGLADDLDSSSLLAALQESIQRLELAPQRPLVFGPDTATAGEVAAQLRDVQGLVRSGLAGEALVAELCRRYRVYRSAAGPGGVLFTGYYEASLRGSRTRHDAYQTPLYGRPGGLISVDLGLFSAEWKGRRITGLVDAGRLLPVPDRDAVAGGALSGRGLEVLWVDDPVEAFFLEVQGSGRVQLDDGSDVRVGYAAQNGRPYRSIGTLLRDEGKIARGKVSAQSIKAYLRAHPEDQRRVFAYNPSVVFFEIKQRGPEGSTGAVVTGGRSIATDLGLFPPGALALIQTTRPVLDAEGLRVGDSPLVRMVLNQDSGGAITGPGRVDLFCGFGAEAEQLSGHLADHGSLYFLGPRSVNGH
jgi:peptidoglycan lytic transglycosylase A